jgi:MFS family permease
MTNVHDDDLPGSAPPAGTELPRALQAPTEPAGAAFIAAITLATVALFLCYIGVLSLLLPLQISLLAPEDKVGVFSLFTGVSVVIAIVANPLAGALSDRTTSRFGRRRPWILAGGVLMAASLFVMWQATALPMLFVGWCGIQLFSNFALAAITATIPDRVPVTQRGRISGIYGLALPIGAIVGATVVGQLFTAQPTNAYLVMIAAVLLTHVPLGLFLRDEVLPKGYCPAFRIGAFVKSFWIDPRQHPDFAWAWLTRFIPFIGYFMATNYILFFLQDAVRYPEAVQGASTFTIISTLVIIISTLLGGFLADRLGRYKIFVIVSVSILAAAMLVLAFFQTWEFVLVAAALFGFGFGAYSAVDVAIITLTLPSAENRAKDMGIANIASTLPQALAPVIAGAILGLTQSYTLLYAAAAAFVLLGIAAVVPIKVVR